MKKYQQNKYRQQDVEYFTYPPPENIRYQNKKQSQSKQGRKKMHGF